MCLIRFCFLLRSSVSWMEAPPSMQCSFLTNLLLNAGIPWETHQAFGLGICLCAIEEPREESEAINVNFEVTHF
ncbi:hypothetical protein K439DRAFT_729514 [Ramaria rubella]|nr:hypothetical protein K439DRAFT_729514 [Ramaria rubella]